MKFSDLSLEDRSFLGILVNNWSDKGETNDRKTFNTDPVTNSPKTINITIWEYRSRNAAFNATHRILRRQEKSGKNHLPPTWWWIEHSGVDNSSFKKAQQIVEIPGKTISAASATSSSASSGSSSALEPQIRRASISDKVFKSPSPDIPDSWLALCSDDESKENSSETKINA